MSKRLTKKIYIPLILFFVGSIIFTIIASGKLNQSKNSENTSENIRPNDLLIAEENAKSGRTLAAVCSDSLIKPDQYLATYPNKPQFRPGSTMPRLGRASWGVSSATAIELAANWNFALEFGEAAVNSVTRMSDPSTYEGKLMAAVRSDPKKYPLQVNVPRFASATYPSDIWARDAKGNYILSGSSKVFSPEASGASYRKIVEPVADNFRKIAKEAHIALITDGGERDLGVPADSLASNDPKVKAAQGTKPWTDYVSERKAYLENITSSAIESAVPNFENYLYYYSAAGSTRNYGFWYNYMWNYDKMRSVSTLPNESMYFKQFNGGWTGSESMLTQILNETGRQIQLGQPLSYNWVNGGWWPGVGVNGGLGDLDIYQGFLKAYFTAGNVGALAGYFDYPSTSSTPDTANGIGGEGYNGYDSCMDPNIPFDYSKRNTQQPNSVPHWLTQIVELSQAQAQFSWLEPFLRNGDLLPGDGVNHYSSDQPSYEFSTGFSDTRVLARKLRNQDKWIITAWAADGVTRDVNVTIPILGQVTLNAVSVGHVYYARINSGNPQLTLIDVDPLNPSQNAKILWDNNTLPHN